MKKLFATVGLALISLTGFAQSEIYPQHFDLEEINLTAGPLKEAQDLNIRTLLEYDADRLLTPFVRQSGLGATTDKASRYYQWEQKHPNHANWGSGDFRLDGHVGGHYLTAMALAYASCHDTATRQQILERIQYMIPILEDCQNAWDTNTAGMYGFLGGQPCNDAWTELAGGQIPNFWATHSAVPLYCEHKILAGLRDLVLYCDGDVADRAKAMFRKLCDFHLGLIAKLTDQQLQGFLDTEHGGVNETLADAYRLLGDEKYLAAAKRYSHNTMVDNMQSYNRSFLTGKHANTQVPKYIGFIRIAQEEGTSTTNRYRVAAKNFWKDVAENRTVCIGGNSMYEHFISENDGAQYVNVADGPESCNSNNMLKLSEDLFDDTHDSRYADFYEGTMYNHMLSTIDPETGGYVYFTPLRPQSYRIYSKVNQDMWCCVGTGMENHVKYGHFTYTHTDNTLFVNLFTPSTLDAADYALTQETQFPDEQGTKLTLRKGGNFTLAIRKPSWVAEGYAILVNGAKTDYVLDHGYATIERSWKKGDVVEVALPMTIRYETCPNLPDYIAFKRGPILLAARTSEVGVDLPHEYALGERMGHSPDSYAPKKPLASMPMLIGERSEVLQRIDQDLNLDVTRTDDGAANYTWQSLQLAPYYSLHHSRVSVYFYHATYEKYQQSTWAQAEAEQKKLDDRTIDRINMGLQQEEAGAVTYSTDSQSGTFRDEYYRDAKANGWMQIVLTNDQPEAKNLSLMLRYTTADQGRKCTIRVNGKVLTTYTVPGSVRGADDNGFFNLELPLGDLAFDKNGQLQEKYTVRITADQGTLCPGLYYIRLMRDYEAPESTDYAFRAADWGFSGDANRVSQDKIKVDTEANTITLRQSGSNNICLRYGSEREYDVPLAQKFLVIRGTNLSTTSATAHYLWWLNGSNAGTQVAPSQKTTLADGRVQLVWDITKSGIDANCKSDPWNLTTAYNAYSTLFGLTAKTSTKDVVISYIGFLSEEQLNGTASEPAGDGIESTAAGAPRQYYALNGMRLSRPQRGINIVRHTDGRTTKMLN